MANPNIEKPRVWIPMTLVNCSSNQQFMLWTNPYTGRIECNNDANYADFEKTLLSKMEATVKVPPDNRNVRSEADRIQYEKDQKKKLFDEKKKNLFFYTMRKRINDNESMVVSDCHEGSLYF